MFTLHRSLATLLLVGLALSGTATVAHAEGTGSIAGMVRDHNGAAIAASEGIAVAHVTDSNGDTTDIPADDQGVWSVTGLDDGDYDVSFTVSTVPGSFAYYDRYYYVSAQQVSQNPAEARPITVANGEQSNGGYETLSHKPRLTGHVSSAGSAAAGITVTAFDADDAVAATAETTATGDYTLDVGVEIEGSDTFTVRFFDESGQRATQWLGGSLTAEYSNRVSQLYNGNSYAQDDVALLAARSISGTVKDEFGEPATGITVTAFGSHGPISTTTGPTGAFALTRIPADTYSVQFSGHGFGTVTKDADTTTVDVTGLTLTVVGAAVLRGTVSLPAGYSWDGDRFITIIVENAEGEWVATGYTYDGTYSVTDIPFGEYTVRFDLSNFAPGNYLRETRVAMTFDGESLETVFNTELELGGAITGVLTTAKRVEGGAQDMQAVATSTTGEQYWSLPIESWSTKNTASYVIAGIPAGTYSVRFTARDDRYTETWWKNASSAATATLVTVVANAATPAINGAILRNVVPADYSITSTRRDSLDVGQKLTATLAKGSVSNPKKVTKTYQWFRVDPETEEKRAIAKATKSTYTLANADAGQFVAVEVTESAPGYGRSTVFVPRYQLVYNAKFTKVPTITIAGTRATGNSLRAALKGAFSPTPDEITFDWTKNGLPIPKQWTPVESTLFLGWDNLAIGNPWTPGGNNTGPKFSPEGNYPYPTNPDNPVRDPGSHDYPFQLSQLLQPQFDSTTVSLTVCADKAFYKWTCKKIVVKIANDLSKRVIPVISKNGNIWTANAGVWHSLTYLKGTVALSYQWYRDGVKISGATKKTYTVGAADSGTLVTVRVTGKAKGYTTAVIPSLNTVLAP